MTADAAAALQEKLDRAPASISLPLASKRPRARDSEVTPALVAGVTEHVASTTLVSVDPAGVDVDEAFVALFCSSRNGSTRASNMGDCFLIAVGTGTGI